ncbi:MAG TPA: alpha-1,2-fucosyltransferase [Bryobacteraceae bacterium]|nr:alpha-1,2-fucosyltransferase [Bryobacteraceae bacterium]
MVEIRYRDRLGNNLFQYCMGRMLAEGLGFALRADPISGFPNTRTSVEGARYEAPEQVLSGNRIDLAGLLADRSPRRVTLHGWFQRSEYYRPDRERIRHWLAFDPSIVSGPRAPVAVHVRRTDVIRFDSALPFSYYEEALTQAAQGAGDVWITTDDPHDPFFKRFAAWRPKFHSGTAIEQLAFLSKAARLVMSASTFSWWAAFLGEPELVICPQPSIGVWDGGGDISLIEPEHFRCIRITDRYRANLAEALHRKQRGLRWRVVTELNRRLKLSLPEP